MHRKRLESEEDLKNFSQDEINFFKLNAKLASTTLFGYIKKRKLPPESKPKHPAIEVKRPKVDLSSVQSVNRIYVGEIKNLIDYASEINHLFDVSRKQFPAYFVIRTTKKNLEYIQQKLENLSAGHPMHFKNINQFVFILTNDADRLDTHPTLNKLLANAIVYHVSIPASIQKQALENNTSSPLNIHIGDHGATKFANYSQKLISPFNRHLGFTNVTDNEDLKNIHTLGHGVFINEIKTLSQNDVDNCKNKSLIQKILKSESNFSLADIEKFKEKYFILPMYVENDKDLEKLIDAILSSNIIDHKKPIFLFTENQFKRNKEFLGKISESIITYDFKDVDDSTRKIIDSLCQYVYPCSDDKKFEKAIELNCLPLLPSNESELKVAAHYHGLCQVIVKQFHRDYLIYEGYVSLREFLSGSELKNVNVEMIYFWQDVCVPYLKMEYNFRNNIPAIELQSIILHQIVSLGDYSNVVALINVLTSEEVFNFLYICSSEYKLKLDDLISRFDQRTLVQLAQDLPKQLEISWDMIRSILANIQDENVVKTTLLELFKKERNKLTVTFSKKDMIEKMQSFMDVLCQLEKTIYQFYHDEELMKFESFKDFESNDGKIYRDLFVCIDEFCRQDLLVNKDIQKIL